MCIQRSLYRDPLPILKKILYCVVEISYLKGFMQLMQKPYLFPLQIGKPLAKHLKCTGYTDTVLFLPTGKAGDVLLPDMLDI